MFTNHLIKPHPQAHWMDAEVMDQLEYTHEDIKLIYRGQVPTMEEFKTFPPEMLIAKCLHETEIAVNGVPMILRKGIDYFFDLLSFLQIYNVRKNIVKPTNIYKKKYKKYNGESLDKKQILCWMFGGGIGDIIFTNPILRYLKEKYPTCFISLAVPEKLHSMVKQWDFVDKVYSNPFNAMPFYAADYHLMFDSLIVKCSIAEKMNCYELFAKWANLDVPKEKLIPIQKPDKNKVEQWKYAVYELYDHLSLDEDFILVQLDSNSIIRSPRDEFKIKFLNKLSEHNIPIIIMDSPIRSKNIDEIIKLTGKTNIYNFSNNSREISDAISVASLAKLVVSVDTGMIHIAASLGVPAYGIYGAFPGEVRLSTYPNVKWTDTKCSCSPCFLHGFDSCSNSIGGHPICYDSIDIDLLVKDIVNYLIQIK